MFSYPDLGVISCALSVKISIVNMVFLSFGIQDGGHIIHTSAIVIDHPFDCSRLCPEMLVSYVDVSGCHLQSHIPTAEPPGGTYE